MRRRSSKAGTARVYCPSIFTVPEVGSISRLIILRSVVLPDPEVPTITAISPSATVRLTWSTTVSSR